MEDIAINDSIEHNLSDGSTMLLSRPHQNRWSVANITEDEVRWEKEFSSLEAAWKEYIRYD